MSNTHPYTSFRYSSHGLWRWPSREEVHDFMKHPHGLIVLACFLLLHYSFASLVLGVPVSVQDPYSGAAWRDEMPLRMRLDREYHTAVPQMIAGYLQQRGTFASHIAARTQNKEAAAAWQAAARGLKEQLIAMKVPEPLKETHLGLVVAIGLDEVAADQLRRAYAQGDNPAEAEASVGIAEERLSVVLQSAPWLASH